MDREHWRNELATCLEYYRNGKTIQEIADLTGLSYYQARRRVNAAKRRERLDPVLVRRLEEEAGVTDLGSLHSGWLLNKDSSGSGHSLYFQIGKDEEPVNFAEAILEVLSDIPKLPKIECPMEDPKAEDYANWLFLADLHVGGDYGCKSQERDFYESIDDLVQRIPPAEKAVLCELGDLLDANDHKAVTPASGNPTDTIRDNHLINTKAAIAMMRYAIARLLETHREVEVHLLRGNHDETAYIAVLMALEAHFYENHRVKVLVPDCAEQEEFRVVSWGQCAFFPHHGDKAKPSTLKDIWADQFPDDWAAAKSFRLIPTAHYHHLKSADLQGAHWRQFRTIHRPNRWARLQGLFSVGTLSVLTVHKDRGLEFETHSNIRRMTKGKAPA